VIANLLPPVTTNVPDGASVLANLFNLPDGPTSPFFAISLSRPGFDDRNISWHSWPSKLALGTYIPEVADALAALNKNSSPVASRLARSISSSLYAKRQADGSTNDPSQLAWAQLLSTPSGYLHWRTPISEIIVNDEQGNDRSLSLNRSLVDSGQSSLWPVAVLDTGGSNILMRRDLANGLYGTIGIGPASDGKCKLARLFNSSILLSAVANQPADYVPCKTPVTISITIGQMRLPLHPLDMTLHPDNDPSSTSCVGAIQADPSVDQGKQPGDIILGVPFLRNVYVVHDLGSEADNKKPRLGIASLTNATLAAIEFQNVRVKGLNPDGSSLTGSGSAQLTGDGMGTALKIGIGVLGFVVACGLLFGMLRCSMRRRLRRDQRLAEKFGHARLGSGSNVHRVLLLADEASNKQVKTQDKRGFFERLFGRRGYHQAGNSEPLELTEDELRMRRFEEYKRRRAQEERDSIWSQTTRVRDTLVGDDPGFGNKLGWGVDEFGNPVKLSDEQRGRQMKDGSDTSGSTRSRTLSPGPGSADRTLMGHLTHSRERVNMVAPVGLELDVTHTPPGQPTRTLGHQRVPLAVEPTLSPLTEAADSQLVTSPSTGQRLSILSHLDSQGPANHGQGIRVEDAPNLDFNPPPIPPRSAARLTHQSTTPTTPSTRSIARFSPASPSGTLRGPRPLLPSRNPYQKPFSPTTTMESPVGESVLPLNSIVTPSGSSLAGPPGLSPDMEAPADPSQWTPVPSAPWPWAGPPPVLSPPVPNISQLPSSGSFRPAAHLLAHASLPPGAAPPMTRQQSFETFTPTSPPSAGTSGSHMSPLGSRAFTSPPRSPPMSAGVGQTGPTTFTPFSSPQDAWSPPPIAPGTPAIELATPTGEALPMQIPPPLSSTDAIGYLVATPGGRSSSNPTTPATSLPPSSAFTEDGHSAGAPVQRW
jgi:hypothetical protein